MLKKGGFKKVLALLSDIRKVGLRPRRVISNSHACACATTGDADRALDMLQHVNEDKVEHDIETFSNGSRAYIEVSWLGPLKEKSVFAYEKMGP